MLASGSPRRLALAEAEGWVIRVLPPPESAEAGAAPRGAAETPEAYVARLAKAKAAAVAAMVAHEPTIAGDATILLACDTLGEVGGCLLGKPVDRRAAEAMLRTLEGRAHRVLTGACLWPLSGGEPRLSVTESLLAMDRFAEGQLEAYLKSGLWRGKAGACGYQDGLAPLRLLAGSAANVVGLPVETLRLLLAAEQAPPPSTPPASGLGYDWFPATGA